MQFGEGTVEDTMNLSSGSRCEKCIPTETRRVALEVARRLGNVAEACRRLGISRSTFYRLWSAFRRFGEQGLPPKRRSKPRMPNALSPAVVERVLQETHRFPSYSARRLSIKLSNGGIKISASGIRSIWVKFGLCRRADRMKKKQAVSNT